jgi:hypothetical protein
MHLPYTQRVTASSVADLVQHVVVPIPERLVEARYSDRF